MAGSDVVGGLVWPVCSEWAWATYRHGEQFPQRRRYNPYVCEPVFEHLLECAGGVRSPGHHATVGCVDCGSVTG